MATWEKVKVDLGIFKGKGRVASEETKVVKEMHVGEALCFRGENKEMVALQKRIQTYASRRKDVDGGIYKTAVRGETLFVYREK